MSNKDENLKKILSKFYSESEAAKIEQDIVQGEQLLADNPAPQPDAELITNIKARVNNELAKEKRQVFTYLRATATTAAAVLIIGVTLFMIHPGQEQQQSQTTIATTTGGEIPQGIWESEDLMDDDVDLAVLAANIDALEDEVLALRFGEGSYETINFDEVEIELMEISDDFWKG